MTVNSDAVKVIIKTGISDVTPFINVAQHLIDDELANKGLSTERLDDIVLYLSAHLVCLTEENGGLRRSRLGEADESYRVPGDKDVGLASTRYGQMVMMLDTTGTMAGLSAQNGLKALFTVVGSGDSQWPRGYLGVENVAETP